MTPQESLELSDETRCKRTCSGGSRCELPANHLPRDKHETEHNCIFYDAPAPAELDLQELEYYARLGAQGKALLSHYMTHEIVLKLIDDAYRLRKLRERVSGPRAE